jgi:hypothetical protein
VRVLAFVNLWHVMEYMASEGCVLMKKTSLCSAFLFYGTRFCSRAGGLSLSMVQQAGCMAAQGAAPAHRVGEWVKEHTPLFAGS